MLKNACEAELRGAMHDALAGNLLVDWSLVRDVLWRITSGLPAPQPEPLAQDGVFSSLSSRERQVLDLLTAVPVAS